MAYSNKENDQSITTINEQKQENSEPLSRWSLHTLYRRFSDRAFLKMLWNILLLSWSWSLGQGIFFIQISTTTVVATTLANWYLASIPIGSMLSVGTVYSIFLPRAIARLGHRPPFYFGALMGMIGAALCMVATWYESYWLLVIGSGCIGGQIPCTLYYRLVALQFSTKDFAPKVIAMVAAGGCLSALLG